MRHARRRGHLFQTVPTISERLSGADRSERTGGEAYGGFDQEDFTEDSREYAFVTRRSSRDIYNHSRLVGEKRSARRDRWSADSGGWLGPHVFASR